MKLAELKKLAEAATPGPWEWRPYTEYGERRSAVTYKRGSIIVSDSWGYEADKNAAFIAAANPAAIKTLVELCEMQHDRLARMAKDLHHDNRRGLHEARARVRRSGARPQAL